MKDLHYKTIIWQMFSMIPILIASALGVGITLTFMFMFTSGDRFKIVSTFKNDQGVQIRCPELDENKRFCLIEAVK
ncbi:MAG: hypothetical protein ACI8VC_002602 [Candidatus Endobugula sp.]|jgi:hypothetical protein